MLLSTARRCSRWMPTTAVGYASPSSVVVTKLLHYHRLHCFHRPSCNCALRSSLIAPLAGTHVSGWTLLATSGRRHAIPMKEQRRHNRLHKVRSWSHCRIHHRPPLSLIIGAQQSLTLGDCHLLSSTGDARCHCQSPSVRLSFFI